MNSKNTWVWLVVAVVLSAFIWFFEHHLRPSAPVAASILPGLRPSEITSVQIIPNGAREIRAERTNHVWLLSKPVFYPAQAAAIEALLDALQNLTPAIPKITAAELGRHKNSETEFGFENPQISLVLETGDQRRQLLIGNKTAPGDQVFMRVVGVDGAFVVDAGWLKFIPHSADDWRSTALVDAGQNDFDYIVLTNGAKVIELHRDPTNRLWRMTQPLQARADGESITAALQQLQTAHAAQFITDDPKADLSAFGLQPADLDLWLGHGTNFSAAIHAGKNATNGANLFYAKREGWNAVFTVAKGSLAAWRGSVNDYRDRHLLELDAHAPVAEIEVRGENNFTLQQQGSNDWRIAGEKFPVDAENARAFLKMLAGLRVTDFVKDMGSATDLEAYGLTAPERQIILRPAIGDTNIPIAQLSFAVTTNGVFVHRADEVFIYSVAPADFNQLPEAGWQFRERRIWNFSENDVTQITLRQDGKTRQIVHNGPNKWSFAAGSQGMVNDAAIEETMHRFGELTAAGWVGRNIVDPEKNYGLDTNNLSITIDLKTGEKMSVDFGAPIANQTALAAVMLDGERWAFVFPPILYQFVLSYLTIPANVP